MSISDQISRISNNINGAYQALEERGAVVPQSRNSNNLRTTIESIGVIEANGRVPVSFESESGLVKASDLSVYGSDSNVACHTCLSVSSGEKYLISCNSSGADYPGAFYSLNGVKVSSLFEDIDTHEDVEITVPSGVDTLWVNNDTTQIPMSDWKIYRLLPVSEYCEENNSRISQLESDFEDLGYIPKVLNDLTDGNTAIRTYMAASEPPTGNVAYADAVTTPCVWCYNGDFWLVYRKTIVIPGQYYSYNFVPLLTDHQDISGKENTSNKVTTLSSSTDTQYPSAKCVYDNTFGNNPIDFTMHVGLVKASDLSLYGTDALGNYHASISVSPGEKYIINCRSSGTAYPGAFYTLNGSYVSSVFVDNATHLNAEITVPSGVDTLWINSKSTLIALADWKVYKILPSADYCEENNSRISALKTQREDEQLETLRRLKNLESLFGFRWKPFDKAYYIFVNDDAKKWLHVAYDVFHAHNVPLSAAVIADNMELHNDTETQSDRTVKQTLDLIVADGGEVLVHYSGNLLSTDSFETWYNKVIRDGKRVIESYGYKTRGLMLADSSSRNSAIGEEICERFFDYADAVGTKNQYKITRKQFSDSSTVADVKSYIDSTVTTPGIYPIMMHGPSAEPWATSLGLDEILTYIENNYSSTAEISTYSAVFDQFGTNGFLTLSDLPVYNGGVQ